MVKKDELKKALDKLYYVDFDTIAKFIDLSLKSENTRDKRKRLFLKNFSQDEFVNRLVEKLNKTEKSQKLYYYLIWIDNNPTIDKIKDVLGIEIVPPEKLEDFFYRKEFKLNGVLSLITATFYGSHYQENDMLKIDDRIRAFLKAIYPKPDDYYIKDEKELKATKFSYTNEDKILIFIELIEEMLKSNIIEFNKNSERPLAKTLKFLKETNSINEFYKDKGVDSLATDMLVRVFTFYRRKKRQPMQDSLETLKELTKEILIGGLNFKISRILASHLKGIRYESFLREDLLFRLVDKILQELKDKDFVDIKAILNFCYYRELFFSFEYNQEKYRLKKREVYDGVDYYDEIFYEPLIKGAFFYFASLGLVEIKYDEPKTPYSGISQGDKEYISVWDGLKYVKLTELGKFILGFSSSYEIKNKTIDKDKEIKFDEFEPIITLLKEDAITKAKLEPFTDEIIPQKLKLSYAKIFSGCKTYRQLEKKIESFYAIFNDKLPKNFDNFFEDIKQKSKPLKKDTKKIVFEVKENRELINLFMNNDKLRGMIIKAEGFRIVVDKNDLPNINKILKENGFFVETY